MTDSYVPSNIPQLKHNMFLEMVFMGFYWCFRLIRATIRDFWKSPKIQLCDRISQTHDGKEVCCSPRITYSSLKLVSWDSSVSSCTLVRMHLSGGRAEHYYGENC